jgi:hypothetical protein
MQNECRKPCGFCSKAGHIKRDCRKRRSTQTQENLVTAVCNAAARSALKSTDVVIDTGASEHFVNDKGYFISGKDVEPVVVYLADSSAVTVSYRGTIRLTALVGKGTESVHVEDVYFAPSFQTSLLSVPKLCARGNRITIENGICNVYRVRDGKHFITTIPHKPLFIVRHIPPAQAPREVTHTQPHTRALLADSYPKNSLVKWHTRLGHVSDRVLKWMCRRQLVDGITIDKADSRGLCEHCALGKSTRKPLPLPRQIISHLK